MPAQQSLAFPRRSFSMAVAVSATLIAAALALALVGALQRPAASAGSPTVYTVHLDPEHAHHERNDAAPNGPAMVVHQDQTHAAQERND